MEHFEFAYTSGMAADEVDTYLAENRIGVLSLANGGEAYGLPMAYHYDGDEVLFRLGEHEESKKLAFIETTKTASFLVYGADPPERSWSILISGDIEPLPADAIDGLDEAARNRLFNPIRIFNESIDEIETGIYRLSIDQITGRKTVE